jgi:hypothetical protein
MFTLKEGSHSVFSYFILVGGGSHNGKGILSTRLFTYFFHFFYSTLHKKKMTMVLVEVPCIACYLPSSSVQNVVQLFVTWERGKINKNQTCHS